MQQCAEHQCAFFSLVKPKVKYSPYVCGIYDEIIHPSSNYHPRWLKWSNGNWCIPYRNAAPNMRKILILILQNHRSTLFSYISCFMFLIDAIKPNVEKKFKTFFMRTSRVGKSGRVHNKTSFVSFCVMFDSSIMQQKQEI